MSTEITYLINLHKEGKIDDSALNKALDALQPASAQTVESDVQSTALEKCVKDIVTRKRKDARSESKQNCRKVSKMN